jgi:hypothetical protein
MDENTSDQKRQKTIDGLREFADFLEANPTAVLPSSGVTSYDCVGTPVEMVERVTALGGRWAKEDDWKSKYFGMERRFGPAAYRVYAERSKVCKKVTKMVPVEVWECPDSLLSEVDHPADLLAQEVEASDVRIKGAVAAHGVMADALVPRTAAGMFERATGQGRR